MSKVLWMRGQQRYAAVAAADQHAPKGFESRLVDTGEMTLHVVEGGKPTGRPILLVHGFPECWFAWSKLMPILAAEGYRVIAVDLPGYNLSDKPEAVEAYQLERVATHVANLIDTLDLRDVIIAGHDWGGAVSWTVATLHPERITYLIAMNMPHPVRFAEAWKLPEQKRRSAYFYFFARREIASTLFAFGNAAAHRFMLWALSGRKLDSEALSFYARAGLRDNSMKYAMSYYAALLERDPDEVIDLFTPAQIPVSVIWGDQDPAFNAELALPKEWAEDSEVEYLEGVGHFLHLEAPARFEAAFLRALERAERKVSA